METRITEKVGQVQSMGTGSIVPQTLYSVEVKGTDGAWHNSGIYQGALSDAQRRQDEFVTGKPHWFFKPWFDKVTS